MNVLLNVKLPKNRNILGHAELVTAAGEVLIDSMPCLGLADSVAAALHGNVTKDPLKPYGNTPIGLYGMILIPASIGDPQGYGPNQRFLLAPRSGPCVIAETEANGRAGILLHGGALNPKLEQWQGMRPTYGCLRFLDSDVARLTRYAHTNPAGQATDWICSVINV